MQYRPVTEEEMLELMELQARSFFFTYDRKKYAEELHRSGEWKNGRAAFDEGGRLTAGMNLIPYDAWFDGAVVGMGGIGGVASSPEGRHAGTVRELMRAVMNEMYEHGDTLSFLFPFSWSYYRKFGYEVCMRLQRVKALLDPLRAYRQPGRAERFVPGEDGTDPGPIIEVYNDFAAQYNLAVDRQGWAWRERLEHDPVLTRRHAYVWYHEDGRPGAYVLFKSQPEGNSPEEMRVLEAAWRSREAFLGLLGFMGGFSSNLKYVVWELPDGLEPELFWKEHQELKTDIEYSGMARVVNAQRALKLMRKPEGRGSVRILVKDDFLPQNTGVYRIDWENGEGGAKKVKASTADIECSAHALAQMVTGYLPLSSILMRGDVELHTKADELEKLFIRKNIYMADRF